MITRIFRTQVTPINRSANELTVDWRTPTRDEQDDNIVARLRFSWGKDCWSEICLDDEGKWWPDYDECRKYEDKIYATNSPNMDERCDACGDEFYDMCTRYEEKAIAAYERERALEI